MMGNIIDKVKANNVKNAVEISFLNYMNMQRQSM